MSNRDPSEVQTFLTPVVKRLANMQPY